MVIIYIYASVYLLPASVVDFKRHSISLKYFLLYSVLSPVLLFFLHNNIFNHISAIGLLIGLAFIFISLISRGALGLGDSLITCWLGYSFGGLILIKILGIAWFLCFMQGAIRLMKGNKAEIPLIPLITAGVMFNFILEVLR